jgi:drug/metabolite transporter (DMT)-like permease
MVVTVFFWGCNWPATRMLVGILNAPPLTVGFLRYLIASALYMPLLFANGSSPKRIFANGNYRLIMKAGFVYFLCGALLNTSMIFTTATQGAILAGLNSATVSLFAYLLLGEKLRHRWQYLGFLMSFIGVIFVIGIQALLDFQLNYLIGNLLVILSALAWGYYSSLSKSIGDKMSSLDYTAGTIMTSCIFFGLCSFPEYAWTLTVYGTMEFWLSLFVIGVLVTFLGFMFYFKAIEKIGATRSSSYISLVPVLGTIFSILLLNETMYWTFLIGLFFVILGIATINLYPITDQIELSHENS